MQCCFELATFNCSFKKKKKFVVEFVPSKSHKTVTPNLFFPHLISTIAFSQDEILHSDLILHNHASRSNKTGLYCDIPVLH